MPKLKCEKHRRVGALLDVRKIDRKEIESWTCIIKGLDNPTSHLLPIVRNKSCSGKWKERQRMWWRIEKLEKLYVKSCV